MRVFGCVSVHECRSQRKVSSIHCLTSPLRQDLSLNPGVEFSWLNPSNPPATDPVGSRAIVMCGMHVLLGRGVGILTLIPVIGYQVLLITEPSL